MKSATKTYEDIKLSSKVTIGKYREYRTAKDRDAIANFIKERFTERYITPVKHNKSNGFCIMAVCCLMIEALESFRQGWPDTKGMSKAAFCSFFDKNDQFSDFRGYAEKFYTNIRCGILHQAETTGGWLIKRTGTLFDPTTKTINAKKFLDKLEMCLDSYCTELNGLNWGSTEWKSAIKKIDAICRNCISQ